MRLVLMIVACCCAATVGCASSGGAGVPDPGPSPVAAPPAPGDSEPAAPTTTGVVTDLVGVWAEYWAPDAGARPAVAEPRVPADTARYTFLADGRFDWRAPEDAGLRVGRYELGARDLTLSVERAEGSGGAPGQMRVELGECPPNDEARSLDAGYRCLAIGGAVFWRRGDVTEADAARLRL